MCQRSGAQHICNGHTGAGQSHAAASLLIAHMHHTLQQPLDLLEPGAMLKHSAVQDLSHHILLQHVHSRAMQYGMYYGRHTTAVCHALADRIAALQ